MKNYRYFLASAKNMDDRSSARLNYTPEERVRYAHKAYLVQAAAQLCRYAQDVDTKWIACLDSIKDGTEEMDSFCSYASSPSLKRSCLDEAMPLAATASAHRVQGDLLIAQYKGRGGRIQLGSPEPTVGAGGKIVKPSSNEDKKLKVLSHVLDVIGDSQELMRKSEAGSSSASGQK